MALIGAYQYGLFIPSSKFHTAEIPTQDFVVQLRITCDAVLYAYLSRIADTAEKRRYIYVAYTVYDRLMFCSDFEGFLKFPDGPYKLKVFNPHPPDVPPYDLRVLTTLQDRRLGLRGYFWRFSSDPERSREFYYEGGLWNAFVATRYMRFLRTLSNAR